MDAETLNTLIKLAGERNWDEIESRSRAWLQRQKYYIPHLFLIHALLATGRDSEADAEFEQLISYKFNLAEHLPHFPAIAKRYAGRLGDHHVVNTIYRQASLEGVKSTSGFKKWDIKYQLPTQSAYEEAIRELMDAALPPINPADRSASLVCTFGSCFAANLSRVMLAQGLSATSLLIEESINSTYANRALLEIVCGAGEKQVHRDMHAAFGDELFTTVRSKLQAASHIVLTVGVAPCFFDRTSGDFVFAKNYVKQVQAQQIEMRTTTFEENLANLRRIVELMDQISPRAQKVITVSPVPLSATAEMASVVIADCVSKSVLRAVVHQLVTTDQRLIYFPAFEAVRWLSSYAGVDVYGADDHSSRHVSNWVVEYIASTFIERFFTAS